MSSDLGRVGIAQMSQADAHAIADWEYESPYDFYDARADDGDLALLLDPARRDGRTFSVRDGDGELIGFFTYGIEHDVVVVGLGLRPDLTGRGLGGSFVECGLAFARQLFAPQRFRLTVAEFNERAIKVYERAGFVRTRSFLHETNGAVYPFLEMERPAE